MNVRWSNDASGNGSSSADASTSSTRPSNRSRARASIPGLWSRPVTRYPRSSRALGDEPRARRDVEHVPAVGREPGDEEPPPARVLPEREGRAHAVVGRAERREQRPGMAASLGHTALSWHGGPRGRPRAHRGGGGGARRRERPAGVLATEPADGLRIYVCAFEAADGERTWLALDGEGEPVGDAARRAGRGLDRRALRGRRGGGVPRRPRRAPRAARRAPDRGGARRHPGRRGAPPASSSTCSERRRTSPRRPGSTRSGRPPAGSSWRSTRRRRPRSRRPCGAPPQVADALWSDVEAAYRGTLL